MNKLLFSLFLGSMVAATSLVGCLEEDDSEPGATGGDGDGDGDSTSAGSGPTKTDIGAIKLFLVNPTDATVTVHDPYQGDNATRTTLLPRQAVWIFGKLYGSGCQGDAPSCAALAVEGIPDITVLDISADTNVELVVLLDRSSATFEQQEVPGPGSGNATIRYVGSSSFGEIEGDEVSSFNGTMEVSEQALVGFEDDEGVITQVQDGGHPFIAGERYFVDGKRTEPPSLLVCNLSQATPAIGCFDYLLQ